VKLILRLIAYLYDFLLFQLIFQTVKLITRKKEPVSTEFLKLKERTMSKLIHLKKEEQQIMPLFNGAFIENKPIPFPNRSGSKAYSNLFYWAHLEANQTAEFPLHPHEGFEIMTFILKGSLEHSDSLSDKYTTLNAGGVQVIQAGSGVQHAERITKGTHVFQIWFDPDFSKTISKDAQYRDYQANEFKSKKVEGIAKTSYVGGDGPIVYETPELEIEKLIFDNGEYTKSLDKNYIYSFYLLEGNIKINDEVVSKDSFMVLENLNTVDYLVEVKAELFIVKTPEKVDYERFIDRY